MISKQAIFETLTDRSDAIPLCPRLHLFLKPSARILITVQLNGKSKTPISNWQIMERLKEWIDPDKFSHLCIAKTSTDYIRFNAELADRSRLVTVLSRLCDRRIQYPGISHFLTVHATEIKPDFPTRHDWDSYFRNSKDMNELKPGERPDTLHIENIPLDWLTESGEKYPSENILKKIFNVFGEVARVDLPAADPSRINHGLEICDAYIQFRDNSAFVKAMDSLKGRKLAYITDKKALIANIKVDFDKTKHMTLSSIEKRNERRDRFIMRKKLIEETERVQKEKGIRIREEENKKKLLEMKKKLERQSLREERRKAKRLKRLANKEADDMNQKIMTEERILLKAQRKLEAIHLLGELFSRIKANIISKCSVNNKSQINNSNTDNYQFRDIESIFRQRMIEKWKPKLPQTFKNSVFCNNYFKDSNHYDDQNVNNNSDRGQRLWQGSQGNDDKCYEKLNEKNDNDRSRSRSNNRIKKQNCSSSSKSSSSYTCSHSQNKNYRRSRSKSYSKSRNIRSRSRSRSRSCSKSRSHSMSKRFIKINKCKNSRNGNKHTNTQTVLDIKSHKHKKKSKKKKKKKHKKSKK